MTSIESQLDNALSHIHLLETQLQEMQDKHEEQLKEAFNKGFSISNDCFNSELEPNYEDCMYFDMDRQDEIDKILFNKGDDNEQST